MSKNSNLRNLVKLTAIAFLMGVVIVGCSSKPSEQETVGGTGDETPALVNDGDVYELTFIDDEVSNDTTNVNDEASFNPIIVKEDASCAPPTVIGGTQSDKEPKLYAPGPGIKINRRPNSPSAKTPSDMAPDGKKGGNPTVDNGEYEIRLGATKLVNKDSSGEITVRIGLPGKLPEKDSTEVYNSLYVGAEDVSTYARVTPRAPDFIVEPAEPQIVKVKPSTAVSFSLIPKKVGEYSVRAQVEFSSTEDFSSIEDSQWTNSLKVNVKVIPDVRKANRIEDLIKTVWKYLTKFWEAFVALFFGALLFVIRKFIKKKTGYGETLGETRTQKTPPTPEIPTQETPSPIKEIDLTEEDYEVIEPETPSTETKAVPESDDDDDYDD